MFSISFTESFMEHFFINNVEYSSAPNWNTYSMPCGRGKRKLLSCWRTSNGTPSNSWSNVGSLNALHLCDGGPLGVFSSLICFLTHGRQARNTYSKLERTNTPYNVWKSALLSSPWSWYWTLLLFTRWIFSSITWDLHMLNFSIFSVGCSTYLACEYS